MREEIAEAIKEIKEVIEETLSLLENQVLVEVEGIDELRTRLNAI